VRSQSRLSTFTEKRTNPKLRLAVAPGAGLPGQFASKDWTLVEEPSVLHSDVSEDIAKATATSSSSRARVFLI
jgi:hypothetical protein